MASEHDIHCLATKIRSVLSTKRRSVDLLRQHRCFISVILASSGVFFVTLVFLGDSLSIPGQIYITGDKTYLRVVRSMTPPTSTTPLPVHERNYTEASDGSVFIFSAFERCHHNKTLLLNVWENRRRQKKTYEASYSCCFLLPNGSVRTSNVIRRFWLRYANTKLNGAMLQCRVPVLSDNYAVTIINSSPGLKGVQNASSVAKTISCPSSIESYVVPANPIVPETYGDVKEAELRKMDQNCLPAAKRNFTLDANETYSFAVCAKLAYGKLGGHLLIEWLEYNFKMGVSKILVYTYDLNATTTRILQHYESKGKLVMLPFDYPLRGSVKRKVGDKNSQAWTDEQVVLYDCYERLRLYKYVAVVDFDEFIVPTKDTNFKNLMMRLQTLSPMASEFKFKIMYHITNWAGNVSVDAKDILALIYRNNTGPTDFNKKTVTMPGRIQFGTVWTHSVSGKLTPFTKYPVPIKIAGISHFRSCRRQWKNDTCFSIKKTNTSLILRHFDGKLKKAILMKKKQLLGG